GDTQPDLQRMSQPRRRGGHRLDNIERGEHGEFAVVLVGDRIAEISLDGVADVTRHHALMALDDRAAGVQKALHEALKILGVEAVCEFGRADYVAKQDSEMTALRGR